MKTELNINGKLTSCYDYRIDFRYQACGWLIAIFLPALPTNVYNNKYIPDEKTKISVKHKNAKITF